MKHATHRRSMRAQHLLLVLVLSVSQCLISGTLMAQEVKVTSLMSQVMTDVSGKEGLLITVEYPPGGSDPIHRCSRPNTSKTHRCRSQTRASPRRV